MFSNYHYFQIIISWKYFQIITFFYSFLNWIYYFRCNLFAISIALLSAFFIIIVATMHACILRRSKNKNSILFSFCTLYRSKKKNSIVIRIYLFNYLYYPAHASRGRTSECMHAPRSLLHVHEFQPCIISMCRIN